MQHAPTIYALSSAAGRAGVAVVRVSGFESWNSAKKLIKNEIVPRKALYCTLVHPQQNTVIDQALVLAFKGPNSFTGEDVIEYHIHGGRAVLKDLLDYLESQDNHRMAEPGEFTRRAFEQGKMDLTEAEAIADLIDAETQAQKIQALSQMGGALLGLYTEWTDSLKNALAHLEADIEFPDEDLPDGLLPQIRPKIKELACEMAEHLNDNRRGERLRDGIHMVVIGAPNAGKSSLINALTQRDVAIVSDMAGTTRDVIDTHLDLGGYPVILSDTAGLRPDQIGEKGQDKIESEGIRRALARAQEADVKILLFDGTQDKADHHTLKLKDEQAIIVVNKSDEEKALALDFDHISVSAKTGEGLDELITAIIAHIEHMIGSRESPSLTRERHRTALVAARESLERALNNDLPELVAEDMRLAIRDLGRITGKVDVEDLLDVIFNDFCIGK